MTGNVDDPTDGDDPVAPALRERYDSVAVRERLHAVPPNEVYLVEADGRRAVLKRSTGERGAAGVEGRAQRLAGRESGLAVPEVLWVGDGAFLAAYDDDAPTEGATATEDWARAAGRGLARLHAVTFDRHGRLAVDGDPADPDAGLRVDADPGATWADAVLDLLGVFRESVADTAYAGVVDETRAFVREHRERVAAAGGEPVLVHGWFSPEHVAVRDGAVRSVIDFEHAMAGAAAYDCWRVATPVFGLGGDEPDDPDGWRRFREGYASVRPVPEGVEKGADVHRLVVEASYLDSLATQRGIAGNEEQADAVRTAVRVRMAGLRERWA